MAALASLDAETARRLMHTSSDVLCSTEGAGEGRGRETQGSTGGEPWELEEERGTLKKRDMSVQEPYLS